MSAGKITRILLSYVRKNPQEVSLDYSRLLKMDIQSFRKHVNGLRAERKTFPPTETELQTHLSVLKTRRIKLYWGNEEFPNSHFESRFMQWCSTNTPYLSYFLHALYQVVEELDFKPDREIKLDVKKGEEFLGEKFAYLRPIHQKEIALWLIKNNEKLQASQGLSI